VVASPYMVKLQATRYPNKLEKQEGRKYSWVLPCHNSLQEHPWATSQHLRVCAGVWAIQVQLRLVHTKPAQNRQADCLGARRKLVGQCWVQAKSQSLETQKLPSLGCFV